MGQSTTPSVITPHISPAVPKKKHTTSTIVISGNNRDVITKSVFPHTSIQNINTKVVRAQPKSQEQLHFSIENSEKDLNKSGRSLNL